MNNSSALKRVKLPIIGLILVMGTETTTAFAQVCSKNVTPQTISAGNFSYPQPGEALDKLTGLRWQRCVYGQTWNSASNTCIGSPAKLTWREALETAELEGNKRIPNIKELITILDYQCIIPPTNLEIFPNTPGSNTNGLWSSTPYIVESESAKTFAWYIDLGFGVTKYREVDTKNFVRYILK